VPLASAAQTKARLVRLLEPGGRMLAQGGTASGMISMLDMMDRNNVDRGEVDRSSIWELE
jgi:hypothetical protein